MLLLDLMFVKLLLVILIVKYIVRHLKGQLINTSTDSREFYPRPLYSSSVLSCLATFLIQISYKIIYHHSFSANYLVSNCSDTGYPLEPECSITIVVSGTLLFCSRHLLHLFKNNKSPTNRSLYM